MRYSVIDEGNCPQVFYKLEIVRINHRETLMEEFIFSKS